MLACGTLSLILATVRCIDWYFSFLSLLIDAMAVYMILNVFFVNFVIAYVLAYKKCGKVVIWKGMR